ncbi:MAG: SET domain-containing protein-lysine N-methyltransferase [Patescibacteria group bacterium]
MGLSEKVKVKKISNHQSIFLLESVFKDEILIDFRDELKFLGRPTRESLQISFDKHVDGTPNNVAFLNHECEPTSYFDAQELCIKSMRDLDEGAEITVNYLATEYDMSNKFECDCGAENCYTVINGFKYLSDQERARIKHLAAYLEHSLGVNSVGGIKERV